MKMLRTFVIAVATLAAVGLTMAFDRGPAIGARLPSTLEAPDHTGTIQTFTTLKGEKGLVLAFTRAAAWCPYCQEQMIGLEGIRAKIEARGYKLAVITTDTPDELAAFQIKRKIGYALLSDESFRIIDQFNLRDPAYPPGSRFHGIPVPSIYFVSPEGVVREKLGDDDYRIRPAPEVVLATLDRLK